MGSLKFSKAEQAGLKAAASRFAAETTKQNAQLVAMELARLFEAEGYKAEPGVEIAHLPESAATVAIYHGDEPSPRNPKNALALVRVGVFYRMFGQANPVIMVGVPLRRVYRSEKIFSYKPLSFEPKKLLGSCLPLVSERAAERSIQLGNESIRSATAENALAEINKRLRSYNVETVGEALIADVFTASEFDEATGGMFNPTLMVANDPVSLDRSYIFRVSRGGFGERFVVVGACNPDAKHLTATLCFVEPIVETGGAVGTHASLERFKLAPSVLPAAAVEAWKTEADLAPAVAHLFRLVFKFSGALERFF
ncbi:MAG: hypothetical protein IPK72_21150 [Candidatus Eisenbacteria bacterium]|nr:hypothetical protein [Candidatus Eisenbacteria bacterium]